MKLYTGEQNRLGNVDVQSVIDRASKGDPVSDDEKAFVAAVVGSEKFIKEFVEYWASRLPRRRIAEFGDDCGVLAQVMRDAAEEIVAKTSNPPRPDLG